MTQRHAMVLAVFATCLLGASAFVPPVPLVLAEDRGSSSFAGAPRTAAQRSVCAHILRPRAAWDLSMCEGSGEPPKRTTGFGPILKNFAKEWEENPQQTIIKLFFFPLSPLFFPVPLAVGFKIYQYLSEGGG